MQLDLSKHEEVLPCAHVKAVLLSIGRIGLGRGWFHKRFHMETYQASYSAQVPGMCLAGKLQADSTFIPPEYKRSAGRPTKRCDGHHIVTKPMTCHACGGEGHFAKGCPFPNTEYRYKTKESCCSAVVCSVRTCLI